MVMNADMGWRDAEIGGWHGEEEGACDTRTHRGRRRQSQLEQEQRDQAACRNQGPADRATRVAWTGKTLMTLPVAQLRSLHGASALR